jgi:hypothetical protein
VYAATLAFFVFVAVCFKHSPAHGIGMVLLFVLIAAHPRLASLLIVVAVLLYLGTRGSGRRRR